MSSSDADANNNNNNNNNNTNPPTAAPNGLLNLSIYGVCSILYIILHTSNPESTMIKFVYVGAMLGINIGLTMFIMKQYCASPNIGVAIGGSVLTWGLFVVVFGLLENYYVWLRPFGNTFGYLVIKLMGVVGFMDKILKKDEDNGGGDRVNKYIKYIRSDPWGFFSMLTAKTDDDIPAVLRADKTFEELDKGKKLQPGANDNDDNKVQFINFVRIKESVAKLVFYLLTLNLMTDMAAVFVMENTPCVVNEAIIDESNNQLAATTATGPPKKTTVYKTTE
jgi:hypothetical protein